VVANANMACFTTGRAGLRGEHLARYGPSVRCVTHAGATKLVLPLRRDALTAIALDRDELFVAITEVFADDAGTKPGDRLRVAVGSRVLLECATDTRQRPPSIAIDAKWIWVHVANGALFRLPR
jgi:hypothetical protein